MTSGKPHYENVPYGWISCTLEDLSLFIRNGVTIKQTKIINGFPITRIESISNGVLDFDKMGYADLTDEDMYKSYFLRPNDILFSHINSPIYVGKVALCDNVGERKIVHGMNLLCIRISEVVNSRYILYAIRSSVFKDRMRPYVQNAVNQASISINSVKIIPFPLPPINEQNRIVEEIEKWYDLIDVLENNKQDLQKYIKSARSEILKLAITGKLVPQNNTDEPANELLKRINPSINSCDTSHYENIPQNWCVCKLKDIFEITMGSSPSGDSLNRLKDGIEFHQGKICFTDKYLAKSEIFTNSITKLGGKHSILLCVRAPVGLVNITERDICIGRGLCALYPKQGVDLMYAFYAMQTYQDYFEGKATGSTFKAIGGDTIREAEFLLPPYNEQIRIRKALENIFANLDVICSEL